MRYIPFIAAIAVVIATACSNDNSVGEYLVRVEDKVLTRADIERVIPSGLSAEDSTAMATAYIKQWIDDALINHIAARNVTNMDEIEQKVAEYRTALINAEYRRLMAAEAGINKFDPDTIEKYYLEHISDFTLDAPVVRGVLVRVDSTFTHTNELIKLYRSNKPDDIDSLDKLLTDDNATGITSYDYFRDNWVGWERITATIPSDFGGDASRFLKSTDHIEVSDKGYTWLLHISDYRLAGAAAPLEYVQPSIEAALTNIAMLNRDRDLRKRLRDEAIESGKLDIRVNL